MNTHTCYTAEKLSCKGLDVLAGEGGEVVLLEEVVYAHAQELGHQANVIPVVEPCKQVDTFAGAHVSDSDSCAKVRKILTVD